MPVAVSAVSGAGTKGGAGAAIASRHAAIINLADAADEILKKPDAVLEALPSESDCIKQGLLEKKILGRNGIGRWEERRAMFNKSAFFLARPGEDRVLDVIPLVEVNEVKLVTVQTFHSVSPLAGRKAADLKDAKRMFNGADIDDGGCIDFEEFAAMPLNKNTSKEELRAIFDKLDVNKSGSLDTAEFQEYFNAIEEERVAGEQKESGMASFNIVTSADGYNGGRIYSLRAGSGEECRAWVDELRIASQKAKHEAKMSGLGTGVAKLRGLSRLVYSSPASQTFFAVVIIASFGASCVDAEIQPDEGSQVKRCDTLPVQGCAHAIAALRN